MNPETILEYTDKVNQLSDLVDLQYDELGELWEILVNLWNHQNDFINPKFVQAVMDEIDAQLDNVEQNTKIVVIEKTEKYIYKSLRWTNNYV